MRYAILLFPLLLVALAGYIASSQDEAAPYTKGNTVEATFLESLFETAAEPVPERTSAALYEVVRVIDGDTIIVMIDGEEKTVRYIGVDTPETVHPEKPVQCFGEEASAKNKALVEGKYARLQSDISNTDKYDRLLRYVYVGDTFVNYELVAGGYARSLTYPPDVAYNEVLRAAESEARATGLGLWSSACADEPSEVSNGTGCSIKGNISSSGNKLFHSPTCPDYEQVVINTSAGERYFCTEDEAYAAGWRRAGNCY